LYDETVISRRRFLQIAALTVEARGILVNHLRADDVGRHQVRRDLDAAELSRVNFSL